MLGPEGGAKGASDRVAREAKAKDVNGAPTLKSQGGQRLRILVGRLCSLGGPF